jgi:hypothetical protein
MLIFAAQVDLDFFCECRHWFADGTFRVTPQGFDQLSSMGFLVIKRIYVFMHYSQAEVKTSTRVY